MQDHTVAVLTAKAAEYATDDRLHNFKAAAALQRETPVKALGGMMVKHTVSVYDLIHDHEAGADIPIDLWAEKITDSTVSHPANVILLREENERHDFKPEGQASFLEGDAGA